MILIFILTHSLSRLVFSLQHMPLMLEDNGFVIEDNFSENKGISHIYHGKTVLLSTHRFHLNPPTISEEDPSQKKCY